MGAGGGGREGGQWQISTCFVSSRGPLAATEARGDMDMDMATQEPAAVLCRSQDQGPMQVCEAQGHGQWRRGRELG